MDKFINFFLKILGVANLALFAYLTLVKEMDTSIYFYVCVVFGIVQAIFLKTDPELRSKNKKIKIKRKKSGSLDERLVDMYGTVIMGMLFSILLCPYVAPAGAYNLICKITNVKQKIESKKAMKEQD